MKIRILGAGFYGCHLATVLKENHDVEVHEIKGRIFAGASGAIPARIHRGFHYPRSLMTRRACNDHYRQFMARYGEFTRSVPVNIYAIAKDRSMVDFGTYKQVLRDFVEFITIEDPVEFGLQNVEGAVLTGERHIVTDDVRDYFTRELIDCLYTNSDPTKLNPDECDLTIDATFCAHDRYNIDRYEPCLVVILEGPVNTAVTVMDGPFPSLYPWNESLGLSSLSSAQWTPFSKGCQTYEEAQMLLNNLSETDIERQAAGMIDSMRHFYPAIDEYVTVDFKLSIRAMPLSGSDARLVDIIDQGDILRIRAGKIDAVIQAEHEILGLIGDA